MYGGEVADQLLAALRQRLDAPRLEFRQPPTRITGGFETFTYGFQLSVEVGELAGPLVLRLFKHRASIDQSRREKALQNALAALGYPVPRVVEQFDTGIANRSFNIMKRIAGHAMLDVMERTEEAAMTCLTWLATIHTRLHQISATPVIEAVEHAGFSRHRFSADERLRYMSRYFEDNSLKALMPVFNWLVRNRPIERASPVVCHGDFHPGNILIADGNVTGVIDWSAAAFADPELDVATTLVLVQVGAGELMPEIRPLLETMTAFYLKVYQENSPLDLDKVRYYEAFRCFRAFTRATALHTPGMQVNLIPRTPYPWAGDFAMQMTSARVKAITGIEMPIAS